MRRTLAVILCSGLLGAALIVLALTRPMKPAAAADYELDTRTFDAPHLQLVADKAGLTFPAAATGTNMKWTASKSIDPTLLARIELPADQASSFIKHLQQIPPEATLSDTHPRADVPRWYQPTDPVLIDRHYTHQACHVHVIVCKEQDHFIVYVCWCQI